MVERISTTPSNGGSAKSGSSSPTHTSSITPAGNWRRGVATF